MGERPVTRPGRGCSSPPSPLSPCLTTKDGAFMEPRGCNRWQSAASRLSVGVAKQAKTVAVGCDQLPKMEKEGVDGSSPEEGSAKTPHGGGFSFRPTCAGSNVR